MRSERRKRDDTKMRRVTWIARIALIIVFFLNVQCAILFLLFPEGYIGAYELEGLPGVVAIQGLAVAFLMWNVTYPLAIINPLKYRVLFGVVLVQQAVGLVGESVILLGIGDGHALLASSILRFIVFDGAGLLLMGASFLYLTKAKRERTHELKEDKS